MSEVPLTAFRDHGRLALDDHDAAIGPSMRTADLESSPAGIIARQHHAASESRVSLHPQRLGGARFHITLRFSIVRLLTAELCADDTSVPSIVASGGGWTQENELARKAFHEAWARQMLGCDLDIKPWAMPGDPVAVLPAHPGPEHARHALLPWGEVASHLDAKAGFAYLLIIYAAR